jgi:hypothetical protein
MSFQTKYPNLGKFWRALQWKMLAYFVVIWSILLPFGIFGCHLVYLVAIWYILWLFGIFPPFFGMLYQLKSGNPGRVRIMFVRSDKTVCGRFLNSLTYVDIDC